MPVFLKREINESTVIGVWEITENVDMLLSCISLNEDEKKLYSSFSNEQRKLHWLSYRNLLKDLISPGEYSHVVYDIYGKPSLADKPHHLSVAHSGRFSAVIISHRNPVGIDIEKIHPKIEKVAPRYLSLSEIGWIGSECRLEQLFVCWGAKEALYKLYGKKELVFEENIMLQHFTYQEKGELKARIKTHDTNADFTVHYEKIEDYMLAYVEGEG